MCSTRVMSPETRRERMIDVCIGELPVHDEIKKIKQSEVLLGF